MARRALLVLALALLPLAVPADASAEEQAGSRLPLKDGIVLRNGTVLPGVVEELDDGRFRATAGDEAKVLDRHRVALALRDGEVVHRGREGPVHRAWRRQLGPEVVEALEDVHKKLVRARLYGDALEVLERAVAWGYPESDLAELREKLGKRRERAHPDRKREAMREDIAETLAPAVASLRQAAAWCAEKRLLRAASALLGDALRLAPGDAEILAQTADLIPPGFPWRDAPDAAARWLRWAAILPMEASWIPAEGPVRATLKAPWSESDTLAIRTTNLLLLSRVEDPEIVAAVASCGEAAIDALEDLLDHRREGPEGSRWDYLEMRLFASREAYEKAAEEKGRGRGSAMPPSHAGCFSPSQRRSLFFVPEADGDRSGPDLLAESVAREIAHQYLAMRWRTDERGRQHSVTTPGFWGAEGIAGLVAEQVRGKRPDDGELDDVDTRSMRIAAAAAGKGALLPVARLVSMCQWDLQALSEVPFLEVGKARVSNREVYDAQATALAFFLVHRRGPEGRRQFVDSLLDYYRANMPPEGWKALGYRESEDLEKEFLDFLEKPE